MEVSSETLTQEEAKRLLDLAKSYNEEREQKLSELPFFYNILEEVRVNENAHTRLLMRLLEYEEARTHFFNYLKPKYKGFNPPDISNPEITVEKHRIDGLIQDGKYAIIFENKICGAVEQKEQLGRYIEKCESLGYKKAQIYILYLFDRAGQEPSEQTWGKYKPKDFKGRYLVLSYKDDIIPWLEDYLPTIGNEPKDKADIEGEPKDKTTELLRSGVCQYLDYLQKQFTKDKCSPMEKALLNYLKTQLYKEEKAVEEEKAMESLKNKLKVIDELRAGVEQLLWYAYIDTWYRKLKSPNAFLVINRDTGIGQLYPQVGRPYKLEEGVSFDALIEFDIQRGKVCVGLWKSMDDKDKFKDDKDKLWKVFGSKMEELGIKRGIQSSPWLCWCYVEPDEAMTKFNALVAALEELGATPVPAEKAKE